MARLIWFVHLLKRLYGRIKYNTFLTRIPFFRNLVEKFVEEDKLFYITKDSIIPINQNVGTLEEFILPSKIVEYFIEKSNYHWIMNFCICREAKDCKNYSHTLGCLFMGEAVLNINPKIGRLVSKEEALKHVKKCREAGLVHVLGRNKLDELWLNAKPGNRLLTCCNCCNCCCISKVFAYGGKKVSSIAKKLPGVNVIVTDDCVGCGICTKGLCIFDAIHVVNNKAVINSDCRGCGRCVAACPQKAIKITIDDEEYINKVIEQIEALVDVT